MGVYLFNIFLNILFASALLYKREGDSGEVNKKLYVTLASVQWVLISGLRHVSVGADTYEYSQSFYRALYTSWAEAINLLHATFRGEIEGRDPGYLIFEKICGLFTTDYQVYLIIIAVIFSGLMGYSVYKNSKDPLLSYILYDALFYAFFSITGLRQTIATAFAVFIGYELIKKQKMILFVMLILTVATIHKSALIFLIFYPLYFIRITGFKRMFAIGMIGVSFVMRSQLSTFFKEVSGYDNYGVYDGVGNTWTFIVLFLTVILIAIAFSDVIEYYDQAANHYLNALLIGAFFLPLTLINPSAMRIVQYFSIFLIFLLPDMLAIINEQNRRIVKSGIILVLILLLVRSNPRYLFFWQG